MIFLKRVNVKMGVYVEEDNFHLQTKNSSYIFQILEDKGLQQIYFGKKFVEKTNMIT